MYTDCFARKKTIDFFSKQMEKGRKHPFQSSNTRSQNVGHVGVYFAKISGKIEDGFTDIFGFQVWKLVSDRSDRRGPTFTSGLLIRFAAKRKMAVTNQFWRSHLFPFV